MASSLLLKIRSLFPISASSRVGIAGKFCEIGRFADGESEALRALDASPDLEDAYRLLGDVYRKSELSDRATERLIALWEREVRLPALVSLLADLFVGRSDDGDRAIEVYGAAMSMGWLPEPSTRAFVLDMLARTEYRRGAYAEAWPYLEQLCGEDSAPEHRVKLAATLMQLGRYEDATHALEGAGDLARTWVAKLHLLRGEFSVAQEQLSTFLDERPDDPDVLYDLMVLRFFGTGEYTQAGKDADAFLRAAREDDSRRARADAIAALHDAIEMGDDERLLEVVRTAASEALWARLEVLGFVGVTRVLRGERDSVERLLGRCLEILPTPEDGEHGGAADEIVNAYAFCLLTRGDAEAAWGLLQRLGNTETTSALHNLALVAGAAGQRDLEIQYWDRALAKWDEQAVRRDVVSEGRKAFADRLIARNQWEMAAEELEKVLSSDGEEFEARAKLIYLLLALNRYNDVEKCAQGLMTAPEAEEYRVCLKRFIVDRVAAVLNDTSALRMWDRLRRRGAREGAGTDERLARSLRGVYEMTFDTRGSHNLTRVLDMLAEKNDERAYVRYLRARLFLTEYRDPSILTFTSLQEASEHIEEAQKLVRDQALRRKIAQVKSEVADARRASREE